MALLSLPVTPICWLESCSISLPSILTQIIWNWSVFPLPGHRSIIECFHSNPPLNCWRYLFPTSFSHFHTSFCSVDAFSFVLFSSHTTRLWDPCFLTRDHTWASLQGLRSPNHWTTRIPCWCFFRFNHISASFFAHRFLGFYSFRRFNFLLLEVLPLIDFQWDCL